MIGVNTEHSKFYDMCDVIQGVNFTRNAPYPYSGGIKADDIAVTAFANWFKNEFLPRCMSRPPSLRPSSLITPVDCQKYWYSDWNDTLSVACFDSYNKTSPIMTDWSADNPFRPWMWFLCNEPLCYWQSSNPRGRPTILSRLITADYFQRQCSLFFPQKGKYTFGSARGKTVEDVNAQTKGWFLTDTKRLLWVNG